MFGIGAAELVIIVLAVIVFVRPEDLPAFVRGLGRLFGQLKSAYRQVTSVKDDFLREMDIASATKAAGINDGEADGRDDAPSVSPTDDAGGEPPSAEAAGVAREAGSLEGGDRG